MRRFTSLAESLQSAFYLLQGMNTFFVVQMAHSPSNRKPILILEYLDPPLVSAHTHPLPDQSDILKIFEGQPAPQVDRTACMKIHPGNPFLRQFDG
jgi:hypothetical protein